MQSGNFHHQLHDLHTQYGPVVRIAPDELSYIHPDAWKDIYGNRDITRNRVWAGQEEAQHPISIMSVNESTHLRNRRALAGAFTDHAIAEHAHILETLVDLMIRKLKDAADINHGRTVFNLVDWLDFLTFDISGELSFGESFDSIKNSRAHPWVEISQNFGKGIALMASINFFRPTDKILKFLMPKKIMEKMKYHREITHEKLEQRLLMKHKSMAQDYVGSIMAYNEEKGEMIIPKEEIEANMAVLIFAGSETSSTAMAAILNQLLQKPAVLAKAQQEVRLKFANEGDIRIDNVTHLDYLDAVIREGIRLGPPAAIGVPRITPMKGASILGKHVPGNVSTILLLSF